MVFGLVSGMWFARPILEASSREIIEIGKVGDATTIKLATNMITAASLRRTARRS